jgi:hypothetical protein
MMRSPYWRESSTPCTSSSRRGGDHLGAASSAATPPTSSLTAPRERSSTPPTSTTTPTGMTPTTRAMTRRRRRSDFDFSSSEEDEKVKCKQRDFTGLCLMGMSLSNISDSDFNVSDDLSFESISLRVTELENALCNQDKLLCKVFSENKKLNLELKILVLKLLLFGQCTMI